MVKKIIMALLTSSLMTLMMFVANTGAQSACWLVSYQPEVPECLRK
jgi:cyclic lactone autoinducer peptide